MTASYQYGGFDDKVVVDVKSVRVPFQFSAIDGSFVDILAFITTQVNLRRQPDINKKVPPASVPLILRNENNSVTDHLCDVKRYDSTMVGTGPYFR